MKIKLLRLITVISKSTAYGIVLQTLFFSLLQAAITNAQEVRRVYDVHLNLNLENADVLEAFKEIESKTDFHFSFDISDINSDVKINYRRKKISVADVLLKISKEANLKFKQVNNYINVNRHERKVAPEIEVVIQGITITGKVTSNEDGEGLPGVNVLVKGTSRGSVTDIEGNYTLEVPDENSVIVFSSVGFVSEEIAVGNRTVIDLALVPDLTALDEIVVVGYGTQKKAHLTGAVDQVTSDQLENRPVGSVAQAIQGLVPNLSISATNAGGEPGSSRNWNIRGAGSIDGSDDPYILVDGVPMDIDLVNPDDIESVSVLKDAAASAIYGARGAFGVILITTKNGSKLNQGKVQIDYTGFMAWAQPTRMPQSPNSLVAAAAMNYAAENSGQGVMYSDETLERMRQYQAGTFKDETIVDPNNERNYLRWNGGNANNNWMDLYYKEWAPHQKHNLSVGGNTDKSNFYLAGSYFNQGGQLNFGDEHYKRYNLTANLNTEVTNWLDIDLSTKYTRANSSYPVAWAGYNRTVLWHNFTRNWPSNPLYLPNGELSTSSTAHMLEHGGKLDEQKNDLWLNIGTTIEPVKGWVTRLTYNWNHLDNQANTHRKVVYSTLPTGEVVPDVYPPPSNGVLTGFNKTDYHMFNAVSSYEKEINDHRFLVLVGYEEQKKEVGGLSGQKLGLVTDNVPSMSTATGEFLIDDSRNHWSTQGVFSRVNYSFKDKYLFEFNARYDGSSKFNTGTKWGFFPSGSIGYVISEEAFFAPLQNVVSNLKLRASYGSLGNQGKEWEFNYQYIEIIPVRTNLHWIMDGARPVYTGAPGLISTDLTWETVTTLDLGLDALFLDDRLGLTFDWYNRTTSDGHGPAEAVPAVLGTSPPSKNNTTLETKGFEFLVSWQDRLSADFRYDIKLVLGNSKSTITDYNNPTGILNTYRTGQVLGEIWGYTSAGFFQSDNEDWADQSALYSRWTAGDMKYEDINNDGKIDWGDNTVDNPGDQSIIGNSRPQYNYGITGGLQWKGFDLNMFWQGVGKKDVLFGSGVNVFYGFRGSKWQNSYYVEHMDYWSPEGSDFGGGPNAYYPKPYMSGEHTKNTRPQTKYMQNGAYIRLKNLQLGYTIPGELTERIKIQRLRFYFSGENLLTFTKLTKLFDPEATGGAWGAGKIYPLQRTLSVGVNISL
ncbi:MAG: TonB-dependent receptor [Cytophagales bacterium]|nr:TonB-dependent receptor [Cytophagales bacterium]